MMNKSLFAIAGCGVVACLIGLPSFAADEDTKPKFTIKDVMKKCMAPKGDKLCQKVQSGDATDEEKKELVTMFEALAKNKPEKGDEESWKEKTGALVAAAKAAAEGDDKAGAMLKKAADCKGCHSKHKP